MIIQYGMSISTGNALRKHREAKKIGVTQFATELGITQSYLTHIEINGQKPSFEVAARIEIATGGAIRVEDWGFSSDLIATFCSLAKQREQAA